MKHLLGLLLLLILSGGCWSRPCRSGAIIPVPCKANGSDAESWRIASSICRNLETAGTSAESAYVDGNRLSINFVPEFGRQFMADKPTQRQSVIEFMSLMRKETGTIAVSVKVTSGDTWIASGETTESGESRVKILE